MEEPAADLGVAAAVVASFRDLALPAGTVLVGELGLGGQLRPVGRLELRLQEAARWASAAPWCPKAAGRCPELAIQEASGIAQPWWRPGESTRLMTNQVTSADPRPLVFSQFWASM